MSPSTQPWLGGTVRPSPGSRTCARVPRTKSGPSTSISVAAGTSISRLAEASKPDHTLPDFALLSQTAGGSTPPTSLALIQPTPASAQTQVSRGKRSKMPEKIRQGINWATVAAVGEVITVWNALTE